jgi:type II secretory pathway component PulF
MSDVFVGVLFSVLPILLVVFCNWRIVRNVARRSPSTALRSARRISIAASIAIVVPGAAVVVGLGGVILMIVNSGFSDPGIFGFVALGMAGLLCGLCQIPTFQLATHLRNLVDENQDNLELTIDRCAGWVERWSWLNLIVVGLALSLFVPPLFIVAVLFLLFGVPALVWQRRRARESQLLWVLALAARHNRDFAREVMHHARGWTGFHACRLRELVVYLQSGRKLGFALQMVPELLPKWIVAEIQSAEETGALTEALAASATGHVTMMKDRFRAGSPGGLVVYGVAYLTIASQIVAFLCIWIVPKLKAIFNGFGTELPWGTELFIEVSELVANYFYIFMLFPIFLLWVVHVDHRGWRTLRLRVLRRLYPLFDASSVLRQLARTVERQQPLSQGLLSLANCHYRPSTQEAMASIYVDVESGDDVWSLLHHGGFINRRDLAVIHTAERVGNLPWAIRAVANLRDRRLQHRLDILMQFLRPALVLFLGAAVGFVCIAMFSPLSKLLDDLS